MPIIWLYVSKLLFPGGEYHVSKKQPLLCKVLKSAIYMSNFSNNAFFIYLFIFIVITCRYEFMTSKMLSLQKKKKIMGKKKTKKTHPKKLPMLKLKKLLIFFPSLPNFPWTLFIFRHHYWLIKYRPRRTKL